MLGKIYILGAGGMAREVFQIYRSLNRETMIEGFLVNKNIENNQRPINSKLVHDVQSLQFTNEDLLINGIGNPLRKKWIEELKKNGYKFTSAIHSSATLGDELDLGVDLIVGAQTSLTCDIAIGNHVIINANCSIHHDCIIEDYVTISPGVSIGGRVKIGKGSFIGIGSSIIQNVTVGAGSIIGAGSIVVKDIPSGVLAFGNPAKIIRELNENDWEELF